MKTFRHGLVLVLALSYPLATAAQAPQTNPAPAPSAKILDREQLERRLGAVKILLESSSAAKQIDSSAVPEALVKRDAARAIYQRAKVAYEAGDLAAASQLLPEASVRMFEAVRLAAPEQVTRGKVLDDLKARSESVKSLLAAQRRIAAEKAGVSGALETTQAIERFLKQSDTAIAKDDLVAAKAALDSAYLVAKAAIGSMRSGDTLVRTLAFSSKREEYEYELDRNETHKMLLKVAVDDERKKARAADSIAKAMELRASAEATAKREDFVGAIKILEDSTRELVRAIRGAGLYIPG